jgi:hypothetical protein
MAPLMAAQMVTVMTAERLITVSVVSTVMEAVSVQPLISVIIRVYTPAARFVRFSSFEVNPSGPVHCKCVLGVPPVLQL